MKQNIATIDKKKDESLLTFSSFFYSLLNLKFALGAARLWQNCNITPSVRPCAYRAAVSSRFFQARSLSAGAEMFLRFERCQSSAKLKRFSFERRMPRVYFD